VNITYIANSGKKDDKAVLPIHSTAKDILEKLKNDNEDKDAAFSMRVFYKGREMTKTSETLEKLGIVPLSKFIIVTAMGKPQLVSRFT